MESSYEILLRELVVARDGEISDDADRIDALFFIVQRILETLHDAEDLQ